VIAASSTPAYAAPMRIAPLLAVAALAAPLSTACKHDASRPPSVAKDEAATLLHRRIWLDHEPKSGDERFHVLVFDKGKSGIYQDRSVWKGSFELFRYETDHGRLTFKLPGSKKVVKTAFRIERARRGEADVHLVIDEPADGPKEYWGYKMERRAADADSDTDVAPPTPTPGSRPASAPSDGGPRRDRLGVVNGLSAT
jgi:hypothetical protein